MLLYIIRHGNPIYDPDSLTPLGHRQAEAVGRRLAQHGLTRIYCSPMIRARQTAQPACELLKLQPEIEEWTAESLAWQDFSIPMEGGGRRWVFHQQNVTYNTERVRALGSEWYKDPVFAGVNGEAGYRRIQDASDEFLSRQGYVREGLRYRIARPNDDRVALFCHQGFGLTWLSHLLQVPPPMFWASFDLSHTAVTILEFANHPSGYTAPTCLCMGDLSHIYAERLPMYYDGKGFDI